MKNASYSELASDGIKTLKMHGTIHCTGAQVNSSLLQVCFVEITRQIKPEVAETVRSRVGNFNPFKSVVDLNESLIGTFCMDNSLRILVQFSKKHLKKSE